MCVAQQYFISAYLLNAEHWEEGKEDCYKH